MGIWKQCLLWAGLAALSAAAPEVCAQGAPWVEETTQASWSRVSSGVYQGEWGLRGGHGVAVHDPDGAGQRLWLIGGVIALVHVAEVYASDVWSSVDGVNWNLVTEDAPWRARLEHGVVAFDGKLWVIGGMDAETYEPLNDVWFSENGADWELATPNAGWAPRRAHATAVFDAGGGERLWVLGGFTVGFQTTNEVWHSENGADWELATPSSPNAIWPARGSHKVLVFDPDGNGKRLWVIGGFSSGARSDVWSSADGVDWKVETWGAAWAGRTDFAAAVFDPDGGGERLWVMGGAFTTFEWTNDVWTSSNGSAWTKQAVAAPMWAKRWYHAAAVFDPGNGERLWIFGGVPEDYSARVFLGDIWSYGDDRSPPQFTGAAPTTAYVGSLYSHVVNADGSPAPQISVAGAPLWLHFDGVTLAGTPGEDDLGLTGLMVLTATNAHGSVSQEFQVLVQAAAPPGGGSGTGGGLSARGGGGGCAGRDPAAPAGAVLLVLLLGALARCAVRINEGGR